jgi:peroxiredoxin
MYTTKKMRSKKTSIMSWVVLPVCLFIISSAVLGFSVKADQQSVSAVPDPTAEKLFREMGIISIPHIAPPVDFKLSNLDGNTVRLSDFKDRIVFLNFWTTWCPECRYEMPSMQKLYMHFKDKGFAMVAINMNEPAFVVNRYIKDHQLTFTVLLDSINELGAPFGIRGIPTTYIIDRDGGIIGKTVGSRRWDSKKSMALFEYLINSVEKHANTNKYEQKKSTSSSSVKPDISAGNSMADSI